MDHILNIQAIKGKLKSIPAGQRLHHFFLGVPEQLTTKEIADLKNTLEKEHNRLFKFIESSRPLPSAKKNKIMILAK